MCLLHSSSTTLEFLFFTQVADCKSLNLFNSYWTFFSVSRSLSIFLILLFIWFWSFTFSLLLRYDSIPGRIEFEIFLKLYFFFNIEGRLFKNCSRFPRLICCSIRSGFMLNDSITNTKWSKFEINFLIKPIDFNNFVDLLCFLSSFVRIDITSASDSSLLELECWWCKSSIVSLMWWTDRSTSPIYTLIIIEHTALVFLLFMIYLFSSSPDHHKYAGWYKCW